MTVPIAERIGAARVIPVLRTADADAAYELCDHLAAAGSAVVELTAAIPGWPDLLAAISAERRFSAVGLGTISSGAEAELAFERGADFLTSLYPVAEARPIAAAAGVPLIEGGFTPGEVAAVGGRGIAKLFPAHVGGMAYLSSLRAVLPAVKIIPSGGITLAQAPAWLAAGAFAVGVGSDLRMDADLPGKLDLLRRAVG